MAIKEKKLNISATNWLACIFKPSFYEFKFLICLYIQLV